MKIICLAFMLPFMWSCSSIEDLTSPESSEVAFEFIHVTRDEIFVAVTDRSEVIARAREELSKPLSKRTLHISGPIDRAPSGENYSWRWAFNKNQWILTELSMEVCDAWPSYIDDNLTQWIEEVVRFCPWASRVSREL